MDNDLVTIVWLVLAGLFSFIVTGIVRRYSVAKSLLDIPNSRSSHTIPTPSSGGLGIVITLLISGVLLLVYTKSNTQTYEFFSVVVLGGILIAGIGLIDDYRHVPAKWRLCA